MEPARVAQPSRLKLALVLAASLLATGLLLYALLGPLVALVACGALAAALGLTILTGGLVETASWDAETGLPDRSDAVRRLDEIMAQRQVPNRQAAVIVVGLAVADTPAVDLGERRSVQLMAALRLAEGLREGDHILRVDEHALAAIMRPSRGLDPCSLRAILDRIGAALAEPFRIGHRSLEVRVSLGACLQSDAPAADGRSWLEAAERAAELAGETREPHVHWRAPASGPAHWEAEEPAAGEPRRGSG